MTLTVVNGSFIPTTANARRVIHTCIIGASL